LRRYGTSLFLAYDAAYELLDMTSGATTPLFTLNAGARPLMRVLEVACTCERACGRAVVIACLC
jgi:hypothetical protein